MAGGRGREWRSHHCTRPPFPALPTDAHPATREGRTRLWPPIVWEMQGGGSSTDPRSAPPSTSMGTSDSPRWGRPAPNRKAVGMRIERTLLLALVGTLAVPALASSSALTGALAALADDEVKTLEIGATVPETVSLKDFEGKATSFKDLRGKVVLIHFWSDRCPAEKHADPVFKSMEAKYKDSKDVVLLGIASNQNELGAKPGEGDDFKDFYASLRKKRDEVGYTHTILADHGNVVSDLFGAKSTPHCFVVDKKGVLQYSGALDDDPNGRKGDAATNYLVDVATALLADKKPEVQSTKPYG